MVDLVEHAGLIEEFQVEGGVGGAVGLAGFFVFEDIGDVDGGEG